MLKGCDFEVYIRELPQLEISGGIFSLFWCVFFFLVHYISFMQCVLGVEGFFQVFSYKLLYRKINACIKKLHSKSLLSGYV